MKASAAQQAVQQSAAPRRDPQRQGLARRYLMPSAFLMRRAA
jgi:hypothetical protein